MNARGRASGLTLVEVLVVTFIVFILAGLIIPALFPARETHPRPVCKSNLKQIGLAMSMYMNDFGEFYPTHGLDLAFGKDNLRGLGSLSLLYDQYITAEKIFRCPYTKDRPGDPAVGFRIDPEVGLITATPAGCSYGYDSQKGPATNPDTAIASDKPDPRYRFLNSPNHSNTGQNVLYFDGHVEWGTTRNVGLNNDDIFGVWEAGKALAYSDSYITQ